MKAFLLLAILSTVICVSVSVSATTFYVDGSVFSSGDGTSWETGFKTIQEGINAASDGDWVMVAEGTYVEMVHFMGKNVTARSTDPLDPAVVAGTIIDGNGIMSDAGVVTFDGTQDETCVLSGFTIRNNGWTIYGGGICGGDEDHHTRATIQNNVITGNVAAHGGAIGLCDGMIQHNTITGNTASAVAAALAYCNGTIRNNIITGNSAEGPGGGLYHCDGLIENNTITGNLAYSGGGLFCCQGTIRNNTISGNVTYDVGGGGGLSGCDGVIENNVISANYDCICGGGLYHCD
jgi:hypothetical protein